MGNDHVRIAPDWKGDDCFIIAGGTSVVPELVAKLKGRPRSHVITINSSYGVAPWADILFFADDRWWSREITERPGELSRVTSQVLTIAKKVKHPRLQRLRRVYPPPGLAVDRGTISMERTSLQGAINIAVHKHAARLILLGADNRDGENGRVHHHAEYPWERRKATWRYKEQQLALAATDLERLKVPVLNASLISTLPWWPKVDFAAWLKGAGQ